MSRVWITGIGAVTRLGCTLPEIWAGLSQSGVDGAGEQEVPFPIPEVIPRARMRRMDRYAYMAVYTSQVIAADRGPLPFAPERVGTIFNSGYGPLNTNLAFGESVAAGDPDCASPTLFSGTVANACVGHVAIHLGLKGVSTILMGSNHLGYSFDLLTDGRADAIYTGGVEEYCKPLFSSFRELGEPGAGETPITEGAATLLLEAGDGRKEDGKAAALCEMLSYSDGNLGGHPSVDPGTEYNPLLFMEIMDDALNRAGVKPGDIGLVIKAGNVKSPAGLAEDEALNRLFKGEVHTLDVKSAFGETLGASLALGAAAGALCLHHQHIPLPESHSARQSDLPYVLVNAYDVCGQMTSLVLGRADE